MCTMQNLNSAMFQEIIYMKVQEYFVLLII